MTEVMNEVGEARRHGVSRRQVVRAGTAAAATTTLVGLTPIAVPTPAGATASAGTPYADRIVLTRTGSAGVHVAETTLAVRGTGRAPWTSAPLAADDFALLGLSWPAHAPTPDLEVQVRSSGTWQDWRTLPVLDDRPDPATEAALVRASQPLWVGRADGVRVRVSGHRPAELTLSLIRPDTLAGDLVPDAALPRTVAARPAPAPAGTARTAGPQGPASTVPRPAIRSREAWNADEGWRDGRPSYNDTILQVHVHHTVNGNDYTRAETAGLIRGMYYYHTRTLGWSDLAYNLLVDRFGRIWEGRAGGIDRAVRGAHTLGFNATSCGVSVIGNFEQGRPSEAVVAAVARVAAWKLGAYGRDPLATTKVVSEGSDKYGRNREVTLPVIDGHRDTNDTACPGSLLYARLGDIRTAAAAILADAAGPSVTVTSPAVLSGDPAPGATLVVTPGTFTPATATVSYAWLRDGVPIRRARRAERVVTATDVGRVLSVVVAISAEGRQPAVQRLDMTEPVRHPSAVEPTVTTRGRRVLVDVVVVADGVADPGGTATIAVGKGDALTVPVVAGRATARFRRRAGEHVVQVDYSGTEVVRPASATTSTTVTPPAPEAGATRR